MLNIIIGVALFAYASWVLYRFIGSSKEGKCASCSLSEACKKEQC